jgi:hypothetical protein
MTIIDGVRAWLKTYEGLADGRLSVDFLPEEAKSYSVDTVPTTEIVKRYLDGSSIRQFLFCVSSREFYSDNIAQNVDNQAFYEGLAAWLERKNKLRQFPNIGTGRTVRSIEISSTAYPFVVDEHGTARYQLQLKLTYFQKGDRTA